MIKKKKKEKWFVFANKLSTNYIYIIIAFYIFIVFTLYTVYINFK